VPFEEKIEPGDMLYTSGSDRIFPRGFPVGVVKVVRPAQPFKEILVEPSGLQRGLEDVLILVQGVHQEIPDAAPVSQPVYIAPAPPGASVSLDGQPPDAASPTASPAAPAASGASSGTEADRLRSIYKATGDAQKHTFGEGLPGAKPPDFTKLPPVGTVPASPNPGPPPVKSPDAGRRANQPSGAPPGGPPH
jgi:rod shape-determining protein MreC